ASKARQLRASAGATAKYLPTQEIMVERNQFDTANSFASFGIYGYITSKTVVYATILARMSYEISNLEDHIGYHLRCLSNFVSHSFAAKLETRDVSVAQWVVMRVLFDHKDMNLNEAAKLVGVDKSSLSRMIERL